MNSSSLVKLYFKNFTFRFTADVVNRLFQGIVGILLANYLGAFQNGIYNIVYSFVMIFIVLCEMGLPPILMRELSKRNVIAARYSRDQILGNAIILKHLFATITFLCALGFCYYSDSFASIRHLLIIALLSLFFNWGYFFGAAFEAKLRLDYPSKIQLGIGLGQSLLIILFILFNSSLTGFIVLRMVILVPETILYIFYLKKLYQFRFTFSWDLTRFFVRESFPILLSTLCMVIHLRIDQLILNFYRGTEQVGVYAAAVNLIEPLWIFSAAFMAVTSPLLTQIFYSEEKLFKPSYQDCFRWVNIMSWPVAFGGTILSWDIINLIYKPEFAGAALAFAILIWGNIFVYVGIVNGKLLIITGQQKYELLFTSSALIMNLFLNFLLIPKWGYVGAAFASLITFATGPIMGYFFAVTRDYSVTMATTAVKPFLASVIMGILVFSVKEFFWLALLIGIISYPIILFVIGGITTKDRELFKQIVKKPGS